MLRIPWTDQDGNDDVLRITETKIYLYYEWERDKISTIHNMEREFDSHMRSLSVPVAENWDVRRHFLLCEFSPMLHLKRTLPVEHGMAGWFRDGIVWFLFGLFSSLLVFSKDFFCEDWVSPYGYFCCFRHPFEQMIFRPQKASLSMKRWLRIVWFFSPWVVTL